MNRKSVYLSAVGLMLLVAIGVQAADWDRAVYWDARCRTGWADDASSIIVRDGLEAAGYQLLDADQLKTWMDGHIADQALSVVVMARDNVPNTVVETVDASCTLRKYLDAGGKIVFYADIPFYDIAHTDGTWDNPATNGQNAILGIGTDLVWDSGNTVTITGAGAAWGLTATWASLRATPASKVDVVLAADNGGNAAAWVKFFVPGDWYRGFVRLYDRGGHPPVEDIIRAAEYVGGTAYAPEPANGAVDVTSQLFTWTGFAKAAAHDVYLGTDPNLGPDTFKGRIGYAMYYSMDTLIPGAQYYWRVDEVEADGVTIYTGDVWTFTVMPVKAYNLSPYDGALCRGLDTTLSWTAGNLADSHDVYFGTDQAAVAAGDAGVFQGNQTDTSFDPNGLALGTTYFYRIDEIQVDGTKIVGDVVSFSTLSEGEHGAQREVWLNIGGTAVSDLTSNARYPSSPDTVETVANFEAPTDVADNYGQRLMATLNVPAAGDYTFWVASDDASELWLGSEPYSAVKIAAVAGWTPSRTWDWEAGQQSAPIHLEAGNYFLMALMKEGGGGDNLAAAWQGGPIPERELILGGFLEPFIMFWADGPKPVSGATNVAQDLQLSWAAGAQAIAHDVYLGTDMDAVANATPETAGIYLGQTTETTFAVNGLAWNQVHYWRVDEVGESTTWKGPVWSFTTADALVIKMSDTAVNYDNAFAPFLSEVALDVPADWTAGGVTALALEFQGAAAPKGSTTLDEATGTYTVTGEGADVWGSSDQFQFAYKALTGDGSIVAHVTSVGTGTSTWAKAGVMVRATLDAGSPHMIMALTGGDGGGIALQGRQTAGGNSSSLNGDVTAQAPYWVKVTREGNALTGSYSADGVDWTPMADTSPDNAGFPITNPMNVELPETVYVGLFMTSHAAGELRTATIDNVAVTGNVVPEGSLFLSKDVGLPGNSVQPVYLVAEDAAGAMAVVSYPDAAASSITTSWKWRIPLSDLAGVDLTAMAKLHLGVGDVAAPAADGTGTVVFRNIRCVKPAALPPMGAPGVDITTPGDNVVGIPTNGNWPAAEVPANVIDNNVGTKFLHFNGKTDPTGFCVTPSVGATIVTGLTFTTANDAPERDPVQFELYGSNDSISGPWTLIAAGDIVDFAGETAWPRQTMGTTPVTFDNAVTYTNYKVMFPVVRDPAAANSMQIAEVELLGTGTAAPKTIVFVSFHAADDAPSAGAAGVGFTEAADRGYTDLLEAQGYNVVRLVQTGTPDLAVVNAADLVIISRSVASSSFQNAAATTWNTVTAPMIVLNGYASRSSRMGYYTGTNIPDTTGDIKLAVADPMHPIFAGISLTDGVMTNPYAGLAVYPTDDTAAYGISVVTTTVNDQGTVLATLAEASGDVTAGSVIIAEWPAGATLTHDGGAGTDVLGGHRLLLLTGSRENGGKSSETAGMFDLYPDGAQMFLNAVAYMLQ
jgi:hypothetical protein